MALNIMSVVETREGLFKTAAICEAIEAFNRQACHSVIEHILVHVGQANLSRRCGVYFNDIELPKPDLFLGVSAAASPLEKTATISERFADLLLQERPQVVMVTDDSDSALDCALITKSIGYRGTSREKAFVPALALLQAGHQALERTASRVVNRVVVGLLADYLFTSEESASVNFFHEDVAWKKIHRVGSLDIDTLVSQRARAMCSSILTDLQLTSGSDIKPFVLLTLQNLSGDRGVAKLYRLQGTFSEIARHMPMVFPATPAALRCISQASLDDYFVDHFLDGPEPWDARVRIRLIPPLGYLDFIKLMGSARVVLTDCRAIEEQATVLGVPCIALADGGPGWVTFEEPANVVVGSDSKHIPSTFYSAADKGLSPCGSARGSDGRAAQRIIAILLEDFVPES